MKTNTLLLNSSFALAALCVVFTTAAIAAENKYGGIVIDNHKLGAKEYSPHLDRGYPHRLGIQKLKEVAAVVGEPDVAGDLFAV